MIILSTEDFEVTDVDLETVILAGTSVGFRGKGNQIMTSTEDVNGDDLLNLLVHVETEILETVAGDTEATLEGESYGNTPMIGTASIRVVQQEP